MTVFASLLSATRAGFSLYEHAALRADGLHLVRHDNGRRFSLALAIPDGEVAA